MFIKNKDNDGILTIHIEQQNTPVNIINHEFIDSFSKLVDELEKESDLVGIILTSDRDEFIAGADLSMLSSVEDDQYFIQQTTKLQEAFRKLETIGLPVVAAINGTALGGGYEVALACHYRIAVNDPKLKIGLPEIQLGLFPGGGGSQRLPRLLGFEKAVPLILQARKFNGEKALGLGLIDELVNGRDELLSAAKQWIMNNTNAMQPWDTKGYRIPGGAIHTPRGYQFFAATRAMSFEKSKGLYPAIDIALNSVYEGLQLPFEKAIEQEIQKLAEVVKTPEAKAMIQTLFYDLNACNKGLSRPKGIALRPISHVGIIGCGLMGGGIAGACTKKGLKVTLIDTNQELAHKTKDKLIEKNPKASELISIARTMKDFSNCELIIEAVIEDRKVKEKVFKELEAVISTDAILASNTSTLPITELAAYTKRPEKFIGLHFFSPAEKMPLVEVIKGNTSSPDTIAAALDFVVQIRKTPILVNDSRGFYTTRVFMTYIEEAFACLLDGVSPVVLENAGKAIGMPVGPLAVADEVGLGLIDHIMKQTETDLGPDAIPNHLRKIVEIMVHKNNRLGRKNQMGFYDYNQDGKRLWRDIQKELPSIDYSAEQFESTKKRLLYRQVLETIKCYNEGIVTSKSEANIGSLFGWGFPAYTGGTYSFVNFVGKEIFQENCKSLTNLFGKRFEYIEIKD